MICPISQSYYWLMKDSDLDFLILTLIFSSIHIMLDYVTVSETTSISEYWKYSLNGNHSKGGGYVWASVMKMMFCVLMVV